MCQTKKTLSLTQGRNIEILDQGPKNGRPFIYLHGAPGSIADHQSFAPFYREQNIRMISINRPGTGASTAGEGWNGPAFADDLNQVMDQLDLERAALVGFSGGGLYACAFAARYPQRVRTLALISSVGPFDNPDLFAKLSDATRDFYEMARNDRTGLQQALAGAATPEALSALVESLASDEDKRVMALPAVRADMLQSSADVLSQGLDAIVQEIFNIASPWGFQAADIRVDTRIWHGTADQNIPIECSEYLAANIAAAKFTPVENAGHYFSFEQWPDILKSLL